MDVRAASAGTEWIPRPLIRLNDFSPLIPPEPGSWTPRRTVSIVIPAYQCEDTLPLTLASLAGQSYPSHLLEVIVVDDNEGEAPLRLPDLMPEHTRVIRSRPGGWGIAHAFHSGASVAEGDVVHRLDADLVLYPDHVETQMRWHHLADYLVLLGQLRFCEYAPGQFTPSEVHAAVSADAVDKLFDSEGVPQWTEARWDATGDLRQAGLAAFRTLVSATVSMPRELYRRTGGMDTSLLRGSDTELGYRLAQAGAVFVGDRASRCRHLGSSTVMRRREEVMRYTRPHMNERIPCFLDRKSNISNRQYLVPTVEAVVTADGHSLEDVCATVDGLLASWTSDISIALVGSWHRLTDERRSLLDDPWLELRLIRETFRGESRVRFVREPEATAFPAPFRFRCPAGWVPEPDALARLVKSADSASLGLISLVLDEHEKVVTARLERTAAVSRALLLTEPGGNLDEVIHQAFGTVWEDGRKWGVLPAGSEPPASAAVLAAQVEHWQSRAKKWRSQARLWKRKARERQLGRIQRVSAQRLRRVVGRGLRLAGMTRRQRPE